MTTVAKLVLEIRAHVHDASRAETTCAKHQLQAGLRLIELRARVERGEDGQVNWWEWYATKFTGHIRSRKYAEKLMKWAASDDPEGARESDKALQRQSMKDSRAADGVHVNSNRSNATERKKSRSATQAEIKRADAAKVAAQTAKAEAQRARAEASKARAEAQRARADAERRAFADMFSERETKEIHSGPRTLLIKALGMLGSDQPGERANAALVVERQRAKLGMTWDELIVAAADAEEIKRAA